MKISTLFSILFVLVLFSLTACENRIKQQKLSYTIAKDTEIKYQLSMRKISETNKLLVDLKFHFDSISKGNYYFTTTLEKMYYEVPNSEIELDLNREYKRYTGNTYSFCMKPSGTFVDFPDQKGMPFDIKFFFIEFTDRDLHVSDSWNYNYSTNGFGVDSVAKKFTINHMGNGSILLKSEADYVDSLGAFSKKSSGEYIIEEKTGMVEAAKLFVEMTAIDQIEFVYEISRRD